MEKKAGIVPSRYSHHMVKETGCFVVNLVGKDLKQQFDYIGSHSGRDEDKPPLALPTSHLPQPDPQTGRRP